jgi:hypothetical protein
VIRLRRQNVPDEELIDQFNAQCKRHEFPDNCNRQRVASVEEAIRAIEAASDQPAMRSLRPTAPGKP